MTLTKSRKTPEFFLHLCMRLWSMCHFLWPVTILWWIRRRDISSSIQWSRVASCCFFFQFLVAGSPTVREEFFKTELLKGPFYTSFYVYEETPQLIICFDLVFHTVTWSDLSKSQTEHSFPNKTEMGAQPHDTATCQAHTHIYMSQSHIHFVTFFGDWLLVFPRTSLGSSRPLASSNLLATVSPCSHPNGAEEVAWRSLQLSMGSYAGDMVGAMRLWRDMNRAYFGMVREKRIWNAESCSICFFELWDQAAFCFWDDHSDCQT